MMFQPELETMPAERRRAVQDERLVALLDRLRTVETPYWRQKLADSGPIGGIDDLGELPFTTKAELRDTYPFGMLAVPIEQCVRIHASSGTSGKPTTVAYTRGDIDVFAEVNARCLGCAGATPEDVFHIAYGYGLFTGGLGLHYGAELFGVTAVPASGGNVPLQLQLLSDLGARGICCTPSFAMLLAERAEEAGVMDQIALDYGILGAEAWSEGLRGKIEDAWGMDAVDIYGLSEVIGPGVAMESVEGKGALLVFDDHFYPEVVDPATGDPVADGEPGELVLTTLTKEALPVLRFRTGDITSIVPGASPCGRTFARIARLSGRSDDMLVIRGVNVFPSEIEALILGEPRVGGQYAIVVDRREAMPELKVYAEVSAEAFEPEAPQIRDELGKALSERLRVRTSVGVGPPNSIPRQEVGKAKRVFEQTTDELPFL